MYNNEAKHLRAFVNTVRKTAEDTKGHVDIRDEIHGDIIAMTKGIDTKISDQLANALSDWVTSIFEEHEEQNDN